MKNFDWKGAIFKSLIIGGLLAFEVFNFATSESALESFMGVIWAVTLAVAACGTDLGGVASIFTEERGWDEPWWVWMLFAAWFVASIVNAVLTWWAVLIQMASRNLRNPVIPVETILLWAPVLIAGFVWLIRVLVIGSIIAADAHAMPKRFTAKPAQQPARQAGPIRPAPQPSRAPEKPLTGDIVTVPSFLDIINGNGNGHK